MQHISKKTVIVLINLLIGLLHFITGPNYSGPFPLFVNGYLLDILIPFGFYFLLTLIEVSFLQSWIIRFALIFGLASVIETAQALGIPIFGSTYDPLDFVMYALGALLAALFDKIIFPRIFNFWKTGN